jgi:hypothetical protein
LAVGSFENNTPLGQTVEVRSFYLGISIDSEIAIHIISRNKKDIELFGCSKNQAFQKDG